jgi:hypothetical protein
MSTIEKQQAELEKAIKIAEQQRRSTKKYEAKLREDPEKLEKRRQKQREYQRAYRERNHELCNVRSMMAYHQKKCKNIVNEA